MGLLLVGGALTNQVGAQADARANRAAGMTSPGDGIKVETKDVLFGSPRSCSAPGEVDLREALRHTPEGREIEDRGIDENSAEYKILAKRGYARIRAAIRQVAVAKGCDCVVKKGSIIRKPDDMEVADLTQAVIDELD